MSKESHGSLSGGDVERLLINVRLFDVRDLLCSRARCKIYPAKFYCQPNRRRRD
jgi:hypothetical protein